MNHQSSQMKLKKYTIYLNKQIGFGGQGSVFECIKYGQQTNTLCVKILNNLTIDKESVQKEEKVIKQIKDEDNNHLIKIYEIIQQNNTLFIIMERCNNGDLNHLIQQKQKKLKQFTTKEILSFIYQFIDGYQVLFRHNIIHRDIKPENIFIKNNEKYLIGDYGAANIFENINGKLERTTVIPQIFSSPQIHYYQPYSSQTDIYSFGLVIYYMTFFKLPFERNGEGIKIYLANIEDSPLRIQSITNSGNDEEKNEIIELIEKSLIFKEENRINWQTLFDRIKTNNIYDDYRHNSEKEFKSKLLQELTQNISSSVNTQLLLEQTQSFCEVITQQSNNEIIKKFLNFLNFKFTIASKTLDQYFLSITNHLFFPKDLDHYSLLSALYGYQFHILYTICGVYTKNIDLLSLHFRPQTNLLKLQECFDQQEEPEENYYDELNIKLEKVQQMSTLNFSLAKKAIEKSNTHINEFNTLLNLINNNGQCINYYEFWKIIQYLYQQRFKEYTQYQSQQHLEQFNSYKIIFMAYLKFLSNLEDELYPQFDILKPTDFPTNIEFTRNKAIQYLIYNIS